MKRNTINIQFNYDNLILYLNNEYIKYNFRESINNYKIINKTLFIEQLKEIIDTKKINNKILTDNVNLILDKTYTNDEIDTIIEIFKEVSFNTINILYNTDIIKNDPKDIIINISNKNVKIFFNKQVIDNNIYFNKHLDILSIYIKELIKLHKIKSIKVYGEYKEIKKLISKLERKVRKEVYIYTYHEIVPICIFVENKSK